MTVPIYHEPQFIPVAIVEAKLSVDSGIARDKVTCIQCLRTLHNGEIRDNNVMACITDRVSNVRHENMWCLLQVLDSKVLALPNMYLHINNTCNRDYRVR